MNHNALQSLCFIMPPDVTRQSSREVKRAVVAEYKRVLACAHALVPADTSFSKEMLDEVKVVGLAAIVAKVRVVLKQHEQSIGEMLVRDSLKAKNGEERAQKRLHFLEYALSFR
jgi:hypothetical protein